MTPIDTSRAERIIARCREIAAFTEVPGETTRTFLAPAMHGVHALLRGWMEAAGMSVCIDAIGNLRGVYPAAAAERAMPRLVIGSHLDTVPNAGAFDGILGVVLGVALVEELRGEQLPITIEIVGFSEEEGVRYGKPYLGSLGFVGALDAGTMQRKDAQGVSIEAAIRGFGLDATAPSAEVSGDAIAYLEVHIEQGPVLESEGLALGVVSAIVGQTRMTLSFSGQANHAGTTPMHLRHDAMAAAAAWIVEVERYAQSHEGLAATVGKVQTRPGAGNVIAGEVIASLDVRHAEDAVRHTAAADLVAAAHRAAGIRGVTVATRSAAHEDAVPTDRHLSRLLEQAVGDAGHAARVMVSGAGHDARIVAEKLPIAMLFLRSPAGLSHHPDESVLPEDVEAALATSLAFVRLLGEDAAVRGNRSADAMTREAYA
jgi:allantoate deiminase